MVETATVLALSTLGFHLKAKPRGWRRKRRAVVISDKSPVQQYPESSLSPPPPKKFQNQQQKLPTDRCASELLALRLALQSVAPPGSFSSYEPVPRSPASSGPAHGSSASSEPAHGSSLSSEPAPGTSATSEPAPGSSASSEPDRGIHSAGKEPSPTKKLSPLIDGSGLFSGIGSRRVTLYYNPVFYFPVYHGTIPRPQSQQPSALTSALGSVRSEGDPVSSCSPRSSSSPSGSNDDPLAPPAQLEGPLAGSAALRKQVVKDPPSSLYPLLTCQNANRNPPHKMCSLVFQFSKIIHLPKYLTAWLRYNSMEYLNRLTRNETAGRNRRRRTSRPGKQRWRGYAVGMSIWGLAE